MRDLEVWRAGQNPYAISRDGVLRRTLHCLAELRAQQHPPTTPEASLIPQSPVLHPLSSALLHFSLPLALSRRSSRSALGLSRDSSHARQTLPRASESGESQPRRVRRHGSPCIPRLISYQGGQNNAEPSPVGDVPHPLSQTLGFQVLAGALQVAIVVGGTTNTFEPELDEKSRKVKDEPGEEAARREHEVYQEEEGVYAEGDHVHAIEDGRIAGSKCFESFLVWT
jgi:hypothetical protein